MALGGPVSVGRHGRTSAQRWKKARTKAAISGENARRNRPAVGDVTLTHADGTTETVTWAEWRARVAER